MENDLLTITRKALNRGNSFHNYSLFGDVSKVIIER